MAALCLVHGLAMWWMAQRTRMPVALAWSLPGVALLAAGSVPDGGWPAAVGAFLVTGVLIILTGLWPTLGRLVSSIPAPIAQAMLAGVLVPLCLAPVSGVIEEPLLVVPILVIWLLLMRLAPRWAAPAAFLVGIVLLIVLVLRSGEQAGPLLPTLEPVMPAFSWSALIGITVPLYIVTMASQNVPGVAILSSYGYTAPWRHTMSVTGLGTVIAAPFGGHAINFAAVTQAMGASADAHSDPGQRWRAVRAAGLVQVGLAASATALTTLVAVAPAVLAAVAGLALLPSLASSLSASMKASEPGLREAAVVTFVVAVSGVTVFDIGAAFWALLAGLAVYAALRIGRR